MRCEQKGVILYSYTYRRWNWQVTKTNKAMHEIKLKKTISKNK